MRVSQPAILVGVLAAASGWFVRGIDFAAEPAPISPVVTTAPSPSAPADFEPPLRVEHPQPATRTERSARNLFAYVMHEQRAAPRAIAVAEPPPVIIAAPPPQPAAEERPRVRFPYRYIGNFGTRERSIAAFVRDGEIRTVIVGGRIDEQFVLRSINLESVDVDASGDTQRIALAE